MWYLKACRSCLTTSGNFEKITPQARRLFIAITGLQLEEGDGFPQYFCAECYVHIKKALQFRRRSRRAHFVLKEIYTIKKQVAQSDVEKVDRKKTNLTSPYSFWKPQETAYCYTTPDAVETLEKITPDIEAAIKESLNEPTFDIQCNAEAKTIKIDIITEDNDLKEKEIKDERSKVRELIKRELKTINSSSVLVDIKPANWREIEKEEKEKRKRERQEEIEAALRDIHEDDNFDDGVANDDFVPEDIDLEDVFKGLKEESEKESESEPEIVDQLPPPLPVIVEKRKRRANINKLPPFMKSNSKKASLLNVLHKTEIKFITLDEQKDVFKMILNNEQFKVALFKCAICVTVFGQYHELSKHVAYHNKKVKYPHFCPVCKDRFQTEDELDRHGGLLHWYTYKCPKCEKLHYTLESLIKCNDYATTNLGKLKLEKDFKIRPLRPQEMYDTLTEWTGVKHATLSCTTCRISFKVRETLDRHMKRHGPVPDSKKSMEVKCDICDLKFINPRVLANHMESWHIYGYTCKQCRVQFRNRAQARIHLAKGHTKTTCFICNEQFSSKYKCTAHESTAHRVDCNMCAHTAINNPKLLVHQLHTHGYIRLNTEPELNDLRYYCDLCQIYFTSEQLLFKHLARAGHEAAKTYDSTCIPCMMLFNTKEEALKHARFCTGSAATGYPRKCPYCDEVLPTHWLFNNHKKKFHDQNISEHNQRVCEACGKLISSQYYNQHLRTHKETKNQTEALQIPCRFCAVRSATPAQHVSHVLFSHTANPYCCTTCSRRFATRTACRDHILKMHAPVKPYMCEACDRHFSHLDYLHDHCSKAHGVDLKRSDKSVYLPKRMFGKIYTYPDMKIDGSLIDLNILERTPVEICDFMDENNKLVEYTEAFFFDHNVDPLKPTRDPPPPKKNKKEKYSRERYLRKRKRRLEREKMKMENNLEKVQDQDDNDDVGENKTKKIKMEIPNIKTEMQNIKTDDDVDEDMSLDIKEDGDHAGSSKDTEDMETEDVMGQLIEKDGEYFVLVDGVLYSLEEEAIENLKAEATGETVVLQ